MDSSEWTSVDETPSCLPRHLALIPRLTYDSFFSLVASSTPSSPESSTCRKARGRKASESTDDDDDDDEEEPAPKRSQLKPSKEFLANIYNKHIDQHLGKFEAGKKAEVIDFLRNFFLLSEDRYLTHFEVRL